MQLISTANETKQRRATPGASSTRIEFDRVLTSKFHETGLIGALPYTTA
jgi:hypothetical protein